MKKVQTIILGLALLTTNSLLADSINIKSLSEVYPKGYNLKQESNKNVNETSNNTGSNVNFNKFLASEKIYKTYSKGYNLRIQASKNINVKNNKFSSNENFKKFLEAEKILKVYSKGYNLRNQNI